MSKRAKWITLACALTIVLITMSAVIFLLMPFVSSGDIDLEIAKLKKQGSPVSTQDLVPPPVAAPRNAAVLYEKAFKAMPLSRDEMGSISVFLRAQNRSDPKVWAEARTLVGECAKALSLARSAAKRPNSRFEVQWRGDMSTRYTHLMGVRDISRIACASAIINARDGKMPQALDDIGLGIACAESLRDEPLLTPALTRVTMLRSASTAFVDCLRYGSVPEPTCRKLYDKLGRIDLQEDFCAALEGERAFTLGQFAESEKNGPSWLTSDPSGSGEAQYMSKSAAGRKLRNIVLRIDKRYYVRKMAEQMRVARLPYREIRNRKLDMDPITDTPKYAVLSSMSLPTVQRAAAARDLGMASIAVFRIALALETYFDRFHAYPQTLNELRSRLAWEVETDPYSGKDFIYKRQQSGYLIYSIGPNLKDDGGKVRDYFLGRQGMGSGRRRGGRDFGGYLPREAWRLEGDIAWKMERGNSEL